MPIQSINPSTGEVLASFDEWSTGQTEEAIAAAHDAFGRWSQTTFAERGKILRSVAAHLHEKKTDYSRLISLEMGKPVTEAEAEIDKCCWVCNFYADNTEKYLAAEQIKTNATQSYVSYEPLGVILGIMPWNYPFWQLFRFGVPTLMAGNTVLLKHASNVPQCSLAIEEAMVAGGMQAGVFRSMLITGSMTERVIVDPRIRGVSLTGSSATGSLVAGLAGRALKKCVLELGGSDPFIVLADADVEAAAQMGVKARFQNTGQSCIAAKRFIVVSDVASEFEQRFAELASKLKVGNPLEHDTQIGPLARADLRDALDKQVRQSVREGARVALGGEPISGPGNFYPPTVLTGVTRDMTVATQETFGPAAPVMRVVNEEEAIALANDTHYGLGADLWTRDIEKARRLARRIQSGSVFINGMVASDPRLPFGGIKESGFGRELAEFGIREFTNPQTVWIGPARGPQMPQSE